MNARSISVKERTFQIVRAFYRLWIKPKSVGEDLRRRELIFNILASALFITLCLLELFVMSADLTGAGGGESGLFSFSLFIGFSGSLLLLSRKGHAELATYLFLGLYFLATTWSVYARGAALPIALFSYVAIIFMARILLGIRASLGAMIIVIGTLVSLGYLETHDLLVYSMILALSWLSNREIARSLERAHQSEKELKQERDLLEIKVEERTRELKEAHLEKVSQLYRFVEFGKLASGIFHDLMNPLSAVALSIEKLGDKEKEGDGNPIMARECVDRAMKASKRMEAFMQTARKQLGSAEKNQLFSANQEIRDAVDLLLHKSLKTGVKIIVSAPHEITLYGNPVKLFQMAVNLISNAIDSYDDMPERDDKTVTVILLGLAETMRLCIIDKGCGIKHEHATTIFEPFFTTKNIEPRRDSGLGLGLSTAREHIEKDFRGTIELETALGKGTTFTVLIPIRTDASS